MHDACGGCVAAGAQHTTYSGMECMQQLEENRGGDVAAASAQKTPHTKNKQRTGAEAAEVLRRLGHDVGAQHHLDAAERRAVGLDVEVHNL